MIDPGIALSFSVFENRGADTLLLGSGLSRAAQIPTGGEITLDLVRRVAMLNGEKEQANWATWYRNKFVAEPSYSEQLALLAGSAEERRSILHSYIEPTEDDLEQGGKTFEALCLGLSGDRATCLKCEARRSTSGQGRGRTRLGRGRSYT